MTHINTEDLGNPKILEGNIRSFAYKLGTAVFFANLVVLCLVAFIVTQTRQERIQRAYVNALNISRILEHDVYNIFEKMSFALLTLAEKAELRYISGDIDNNAMQNYMAKQLLLVPETESLLFTDALGNIVTSDKRYDLSGLDVSDRDYFVHCRNNPDVNIYISRPLLSRITHKWVIVIARRINQPDGTFLGVIAGTLSLEYFTNLFGSLEIGTHGGISLRDGEMGIMARFPAPKDPGSIIGNKVLSPEMRKLFESGQTEGTFFTPTSWDNTAKIVSYHKIDKFPLYLNVGIATEDYLSNLWREKLFVASLSLLYFIATLVLSWALFTRYKRDKINETNMYKLNLDLENRIIERTDKLQSKNIELISIIERIKKLEGIIPICMYCKKIRDDNDSWQQLEKYITQHSEAQFSHGICPKCFKEHLGEELKHLKSGTPLKK